MSTSYSLKQIQSLCPPSYFVKIVDEAFEKIKYDDKYDLVGVSCIHTNAAFRAYEIADEFRRRGITVVLGGWHPSVLPEEAKQHADAVVVGEAEDSWPELLRDFENGHLKSFYKQEEPTDPKKIPIIDHSIFKKKSLSCLINATRGCPYRCNFCSISNQKFGCVFRKRDIDDVVEEVKKIPNKHLVFVDTSFSIDLDYTKKLFKRLNGLNKKFRCWMNANIPLDDEFLKITSDAGCIAIEMGLETLSKKTLSSLNKKTNDLDQYKKIIRKLHDYGMAIGATFVFGFDADTKSVFDETIKNLYSLNIDFPRFAILTPYPGTPLFNDLEKNGRILTRDWSKYDMTHVVFEPKKMSPEELQNGWYKVCEDVYSIKNITKRVFTNNSLKFSAWLWKTSLNYVEKIR